MMNSPVSCGGGGVNARTVSLAWVFTDGRTSVMPKL